MFKILLLLTTFFHCLSFGNSETYVLVSSNLNHFCKCDINTATSLSLSDMKIAMVDVDTFQGLTNITSISLSFNDVTKYKASTFRGLINLERLYLHV
jgi:hypothetical protein